MNFNLKWLKASVLGWAVILSALVLLIVKSGDISIAQAKIAPPVIGSIAPTSGDNGVDTSIVIRGSGFADPLVVTLDSGTESQELTVEYSDSGQINAVVPAGMTPDPNDPYDLKVSRVGVEATLPDAFTVKPHVVTRDLRSDPTWLWSEPHPIQIGIQNSGVGLLVQHVDHQRFVDQVTVEFRLGSATGTLLGRSQTSVIAPLAIESTGKVLWAPETAGEYTLCAIIDPDDEIEEADESNNTVCRTVSVLPPAVNDVTPPQVDSFIIADGAESTPQITVTLDVSATDYLNPGASGLNAIKYIEFEYSYQASKWVVVNQSAWLDYDTSRLDHSWTLTSTYGTRYMQAWVKDNDNNISEAPGIDVISLPPQDVDAQIAQHEVDFYRIYLEQGDIFTATVTPSSGDPDLYVWGTSGRLEGYSQNFFTEVETVSFVAPNDGTYQIEVHGYQASDYRLSFGTSTNLVQAVPQRTFAVAGPKPLPDAPNVSIDSVPLSPVVPRPASQGVQFISVIDSVTPTSGNDNLNTTIVIRGSGFAEPLSVTLDNGSESQLLTVKFSDDAQINAVVPAGMRPGVYDLTVSTAQGQVTKPDAFEVRARVVPRDLQSDPTWLWSEPQPMRVGIQNTGVGLLVQHVGDQRTIDQVTVEFRLGSATGTLLGRRLTNIIAPESIESTGKVLWAPQTAGEYTVCAIIDPDDEVEEADESNNTVCRPVTVLQPVADVTLPQVDSFIIADGALSTANPAVTLDVSATDYGNPTPSGVSPVKYIEFEYSLQALRWVVVNESGWLDYDTSRLDHPWNLSATYGTHYIQAFVADNERNISQSPGVDIISYLPQDVATSIPQHGVHFYRIRLSAGDSFSATLTPSVGDADLYVWGTSGQLVRHSQNFSTEVDTVSFEAANDGTYQIEVRGYQASDYRLSFGTTTNLVQAVPQRTFAVAGPKPLPDAPNVPVDSVPQAAPPVDLPEPPNTGSTIFLPITIR